SRMKRTPSPSAAFRISSLFIHASLFLTVGQTIGLFRSEINLHSDGLTSKSCSTCTDYGAPRHHLHTIRVELRGHRQRPRGLERLPSSRPDPPPRSRRRPPPAIRPARPHVAVR